MSAGRPSLLWMRKKFADSVGQSKANYDEVDHALEEGFRKAAAQEGAKCSDAHKMIENLRSGGDWEGDAAVAFREQLDGALPTNLKNAHSSITRAATALADWQKALDGYQQRARALDSDAKGKIGTAEGHGSFLGSGYTFWVRGVRSGEIGEVWFAGDPRFLGVVAVPGPRRLFGVAQRTAVDDRMSARKRGVSAEAPERAKAAGARVG